MKKLKLKANVYGNKIKTSSKFNTELEFTYYMFEFYQFIGFRTPLTIYFPEKGEHIAVATAYDSSLEDCYSTFTKDNFTVNVKLKDLSLTSNIYTVDDFVELFLTAFNSVFNTKVHIEK